MPRILASLTLLPGVLFIAGSPLLQAEDPAPAPTGQLPAPALAPAYAPTGQLPAAVAVPAYVPAWQVPAPAAAADQEVIQELLDILNTTNSVDTFRVVVSTLAKMKPRDRRLIPKVIRAAERIGVLKRVTRAGQEGASQERGDKSRAAEEMLELFDVVLDGPNGGLTAAAAGGLVGEGPCCVPAAAQVAVRAPSYEDVVRMTQSGVPDKEITDRIRLSGAIYHPNADQLVYLNQNGVHEAVIKELQATAYARPDSVRPAPPPVHVVSPAPPRP